MEHDPKSIMCTALYLAYKVDFGHGDTWQPVQELCKNMHAEVSQVLENELIVLQGVNFNLQVFHPTKSIHAFMESWLATDTEKSIPDDLKGRIIQRALTMSDMSLLTDLGLLYTPAQLALGCLRMSTGQESAALVPHFDTWLAHKFRADEVHQLMEICKSVSSALQAAAQEMNLASQPATRDELKRINAKLKNWVSMSNGDGKHTTEREKQEHLEKHRKRLEEQRNHDKENAMQI